jgi:hypothetical protein
MLGEGICGAPVRVGPTNSSSEILAISAKWTPSWKCSAKRRPSSGAILVFATPPAPAMVTRRLLSNSRSISRWSGARPSKEVKVRGRLDGFNRFTSDVPALERSVFEKADRLFKAFFTTKCSGIGMGRSINLDEARSAVEWVTRETNRASEMIRRVRALANRTSIEKAPLDVNDVVREAIALVQRELISQRVSLRTDFAPAPMILGDRVQLQQVIINLVMNGIEAMQSVTDRPRELVIRSLRDEKLQALVSVTDCGVGISAEDADRLFTAFFTTKSSGMGMGLSICRSIIEAHGGRLWATANVPHGATFQFTLPVNADTAS